jgi:hypothetical protein
VVFCPAGQVFLFLFYHGNNLTLTLALYLLPTPAIINASPCLSVLLWPRARSPPLSFPTFPGLRGRTHSAPAVTTTAVAHQREHIAALVWQHGNAIADALERDLATSEL